MAKPQISCVLLETSSIKEIKDYLKRQADVSVSVDIYSDTNYFETYGNLVFTWCGKTSEVFFSDFNTRELAHYKGIDFLNFNKDRVISFIGDDTDVVNQLFTLLLERFQGFLGEYKEGGFVYQLFIPPAQEALGR